MKSNELRIGNLINTYVGKVIGQKDMVICEINHIKHISEGNEYGYEPIPLTEEWLLKFGFTYDVLNEGDTPTWHLDGKYFYIDPPTLQPTDAGFPIAKIKIEHVHQLQNLYFALTGTELEMLT